MSRAKIELVPGIRYRGTACVNEYGELTFEPYQKAGEDYAGFRLVKHTGDVRMYESRNCWRFVLTFGKNTINADNCYVACLRAMQTVIQLLKKYL